VIRPLRVYADASVFGGVFDQVFSEASLAFLDQVRSGRFQLMLSAAVEDEIAAAPERVRTAYRDVAALAEVLAISDEVIQLREAYIEGAIVSPRRRMDALHVACATAYGCQMLVSWNSRHIVNETKIALYNATNVQKGFAPIGILSPLEVIDYDERP
jgi:predicted nucleic acid-binding protein